MAAWRYEISLLVFHSISHSFAALTLEISGCLLQELFSNISVHPSRILHIVIVGFIFTGCTLRQQKQQTKGKKTKRN